MENYSWTYLKKHPKQAKRLLGIDYQQLEELIELGKFLAQRKREDIERKKIRINRAGGGNHAKLSVEEQIVLMLIYLRHHLSFQLLGLMFQISESTAHNIFTYWQNLLAEELPPSLLEQVKKCQENEEKIKEELTQYELIVDSCEQAIERPFDYQEQKKFYSGKKKQHTFKNQFIVLPDGQEIIDVVSGQPGPVSDIGICRKTLNKFDEKQQFKGDKAYIGEPQILTPTKKPKKGELTKTQKQNNRVLSQGRIFVEHLIRLVKIFKIIQERFRLNKKRYKSVLSLVCGLVRLRLGSLILEVIKFSETGETIDIVMTHLFPTKMDVACAKSH